MRNLRLIFFSTLISACLCRVPSCGEIEKMRAAIQDLVDGDISRIPTAVRFGFHSCVGGCNGCINLKENDNMGFDEFSTGLEETYQKLNLQKFQVSRADFWALVATVATESAINKHGGPPIKVPCFKYHWGRQDCPTSPNLTEFNEFPGPGMTGKQMFSYFKREFDFEKDEVVAILGAHTLGNSEIRNTGHRGSWTPLEEDVFNVTYYQNMATKPLKWINKDATEGMPEQTKQHWQWEAELPDGSVSMMLNTDFEIFFDLELDETGKTTCTLDPECYTEGTCGENNICAMAETYGQGAKYITHPNLFYKDFHDAFDKMLRTGSKKLVTRGGTCSCI